MKHLKRIIVFLLIIIFIIVTVISFSFYLKKYTPTKIYEGDNLYIMKSNKNINISGIDEIVSLLSKTNLVYNYIDVDYVNIVLNKNADIKSFTVNLNLFKDDLSYDGKATFDYKDKKITYNYLPICSDKIIANCTQQNEIVVEYNNTSSIENFNKNLKLIPIKNQIKLSSLKSYIISYKYNQSFTEKTNVYDMRDSIKEAVSLNDYKKGNVGTISPGIYFDINLSDGSSVLADEIYHYIFEYEEGDIPKLDYSSELDYYINNNKLSFTRDYGNSWISTSIQETKLKETLDFYKSNSLLANSWFISRNINLPIAYFYGTTPTISISLDNGVSYKDIEVAPLEKEITHRVVGFASELFGYYAIGTDWTMGTGETHKGYLTNDRGTTWNEISLPENNNSHTLIDFMMYNQTIGIITLNDTNEQYPIVYSTQDAGKTWQLVNYKENIPTTIQYLYDIDKIECINETYYIQLGQALSGTKKAIFTTTDLINWEFNKETNENIHTVG